MDKKTYVALILDQSGSMSSIRKQTVDGYNEQVEQMQINSKDQDIFSCLVTFNGEVFEHQWLKRASDLTKATHEEYITEGATAFRDAVGYTINKLLSTTDTNDKNNAYLVVIISDGQENSSQHVSEPALRELIETCQNKGNWTFSYMGCTESHVKAVAKTFAIPEANTAVWKADYSNASKALHRNSNKIGLYYSNRSKGVISSNKLYGESALADFSADYNDADDLDVVAVPSADMSILNMAPVTCDVTNIVAPVTCDITNGINVCNNINATCSTEKVFRSNKPVTWNQ